MSEPVSNATILIDVDASDPGDISPSLIDLLGPHKVVVLGYYPVPDQSSAGQLRKEFNADATAAVERIADQFSAHGASVESTVVFTHDRDKTIFSTADEYDVDAVLTAGTIGERLESVLVPLRGEPTVEHIAEFVSTLLRESDANVTLFNIPESEDEASTGEFLLRGVRDRLVDEGLSHDRVEWRQEFAASPTQGIIDESAEYDLLIVGETEPSLRERILGTVTSGVVGEAACPALIVRN
ncbi:MAG: universal stress protein UspA related nucleotide-binding protein [uncultured archaeon A07HR60]|nr:MAG: universal stress protein UspA related nucleotide-binding protein [uncultured archaeon A07HR60]